MNDYRKSRLITIARQMMPELRTGRTFHIAFILKSNKILALAPNNYNKNHLSHIYGEYKPLRSPLGNYIPSRHAEVNCLRIFLNKFGHLDMSGLTLFVVRIGMDGEVKNSCPCQNCSRVLNGLNFKCIEWT